MMICQVNTASGNTYIMGSNLRHDITMTFKSHGSIRLVTNVLIRRLAIGEPMVFEGKLPDTGEKYVRETTAVRDVTR